VMSLMAKVSDWIAEFLEKENEMNKSESIKMLAGALSLTQAEMPAVKFNATNPFFKK